jgi:hypothetical protein
MAQEMQQAKQNGNPTPPPSTEESEESPTPEFKEPQDHLTTDVVNDEPGLALIFFRNFIIAWIVVTGFGLVILATLAATQGSQQIQNQLNSITILVQ